MQYDSNSLPMPVKPQFSDIKQYCIDDALDPSEEFDGVESIGVEFDGSYEPYGGTLGATGPQYQNQFNGQKTFDPLHQSGLIKKNTGMTQAKMPLRGETNDSKQ